MNADLAKLLVLQEKDAAVVDARRRLDAVRREWKGLDAAVEHARTSLRDAERAATDAVRCCSELEAQVETHRAAQERRRQRLDKVHNEKEATAAMTELELAGAVQAKEEAAWVQSAELVEQRQQTVRDLEHALAAAEAAQAPERERLGAQLKTLEKEHAATVRDRETSAERVERGLRLRYDRLRGSRTSAVVVPLVGSTCGACFTSIPLNRRTQIKSGQVIDGCEACGAILYPLEPPRGA
jgi:predicted  nucleic acid-binding Zn-ribbon protein